MEDDMMENSNGMETDAFYDEREKEREELAALTAYRARIAAAIREEIRAWRLSTDGAETLPDRLLRVVEGG